jgi:6-phosphogluconate dehydrogenase
MNMAQIGLIGLGVMGSSLAKNLINHGFDTALYSISEAERNRFRENNGQGCYTISDSLEDFVKRIEKPRKILLMVTAGEAVDIVSDSLLPFLSQGDIIIDGGNSYYKDTNRRRKLYESKGIQFVGLGISGGEKGALEGPSMMFGGSSGSWSACKNILQTVAAATEGHSCCGYVSEEGSGHYVKMVHNGIEYGNLQLIAEAYYFMKRGLHMSADECSEVFLRWSKGKLSSYLIEITAVVLKKKEEDAGNLVDKIKDVAGQKGTGIWTLWEGIERKVYIPTIFEAVSMRNYSAVRQTLRIDGKASEAKTNRKKPNPEKDRLLSGLEKALYISQLCCYAQGIELIQKASEDFGWEIAPADVVSLWENGCIIRSALACEIADTLKTSGNKVNNILYLEKLKDIAEGIDEYREIAAFAVENGICIPALLASLSYYDAYHMEQMPINLIQGLRDCFGAHTYERIDREGIFHSKWE